MQARFLLYSRYRINIVNRSKTNIRGNGVGERERNGDGYGREFGNVLVGCTITIE